MSFFLRCWLRLLTASLHRKFYSFPVCLQGSPAGGLASHAHFGGPGSLLAPWPCWHVLVGVALPVFSCPCLSVPTLVSCCASLGATPTGSDRPCLRTRHLMICGPSVSRNLLLASAGERLRKRAGGGLLTRARQLCFTVSNRPFLSSQWEFLNHWT